jgi:hypothetical protein
MLSSHASRGARPATSARETARSPADARTTGRGSISALDELMTWPPDAQLACPMCGGTTEGLLDRGGFSSNGGGLVVRTEALPCGCDVSDQAQTLQAAAIAAGYLDLEE